MNSKHFSFVAGAFRLVSLWAVCGILCVSAAFAQTYQVGHITRSFTDASRSNRVVPVEIYYPADVAGNDVPFAAGYAGKAPYVSFGHGFVMTYDAYANIRDLLVANGYVVAFPTTEGGFSPSHSSFGRDLAFVLREVANLGAMSSSVLFNKVDTANCVMGHSMGGGAAFLAASYDPQIKAIVTFAAAETSPSAIGAASSVSVPALVFAGQNDCVTPPPAHQQPMYSGLASACKQYVAVRGGSHCQMAAASVTCSFGEASCTPAPTITRDQQHAKLAEFLVPWLNYTLKKNCAEGAAFDAALAAGVGIDYSSNCSLCSTSGIVGLPEASFVSVCPNPCSNNLTFSFTRSGTFTISLFSALGQKVHTATGAASIQVNTRNYAKGVYAYCIEQEGSVLTRGTVLLAD